MRLQNKRWWNPLRWISVSVEDPVEINLGVVSSSVSAATEEVE